MPIGANRDGEFLPIGTENFDTRTEKSVFNLFQKVGDFNCPPY